MKASECNAIGMSPVRLLIIVAASVYLEETLIMVVLARLPDLSPLGEALLDSTLLIAFCFPALYWFMYRPMVRHVALQRRADARVAEERLRIFKATMRTVQDLVNNGLMNLQLFRLDAADRLPPETLAVFDEVFEHLRLEVKTLADLEVLMERPMVMGDGIGGPERTLPAAPAGDRTGPVHEGGTRRLETQAAAS